MSIILTRITKVKLLDNGDLYFCIDDEKRFIECVIEYDTEKDKFLVRANDHICGEI